MPCGRIGGLADKRGVLIHTEAGNARPGVVPIKSKEFGVEQLRIGGGIKDQQIGGGAFGAVNGDLGHAESHETLNEVSLAGN